MPYWFCPKCQKVLEEKDRHKALVQIPASPGPFIAGHILNNPNLPIIGAQLHNSSTIGNCWHCSKCGTPASINWTNEEIKEEKRIREKNKMFGVIFWIIVIIIIIAFFSHLSNQAPPEN